MSNIKATRRRVRNAAIEQLLGEPTDRGVIVDNRSWEAVEGKDTEECLAILESYDGPESQENWNPFAVAEEHWGDNDTMQAAIRKAAATTIQHMVLDDLDELGIE